MALVLNDRVKETTTSTGTGTVNLAGAETNFETFVAGVGNTNTTYYAIVHQSAAEFEVGLGTVSDSSPDTLSRTTILSSSNSDSAVNFSSGTKDVFCTLPASKAVHEDASGNVTLPGTLDVDGGITVDNITIDSTEIDLSSGDLTIDVEGDIILDANGEHIRFKDNGTEWGNIESGSNNFNLTVSQQDKDFLILGNDDGTGFTALTIDMSDAGTASFNHDIKLPDNGMALFGAGLDLALYSDGTNSHIESGGDLDLDVTGNITLDANGGVISLQDNGVETGQLKPDSAGLILQAVGSDLDIFFSGSDGGSAITAVRVDMSDAGHLICNGNVTAFGSTSDIKLKENIEVIPDALDKVKQLKGITFNYKKDGKVSTGLIAQDLEKVLPEAVYEASAVDDDEDKHLAVRYGNTVGLLVEAIKELEARVKELEGK